MCGVEGIDDSHQVRFITKPFEVSLKVGGRSFKLGIWTSHPTEIVGPTIVRWRVARDVIHFFIPCFPAHDGCPVFDGWIEHGFGALFGVDGQFDRFGVGCGEQLNQNPVAVHWNRTVDVQGSVGEQENVVGRGGDSQPFAHKQQVVPLTCTNEGLAGRTAIDGKNIISRHRHRLFLFSEASCKRAHDQKKHEHQGLWPHVELAAHAPSSNPAFIGVGFFSLRSWKKA